MKGVIMEIRDKSAIVFSDEGLIVKVKNLNYQIGQEVEVDMKKNYEFKPKKKFVFAAAVACLVLLFGGSTFAYYQPATYVSLDVNPSIEYSVNMFHKVISVKGVNDDGSEIIDEIDMDNMKNKSIEEAISLTVDQIAETGYLDSGEGGIVITTSNKNMDKAEKLAQNLEKVANDACEKNNCKATVAAQAVGSERVAQAKELGVTPGKLNLVEKLMESAEDSEDIDLNEWLGKSVKDIMAQINQYKEQNVEQEQNAGEITQNQEQNQNEESNGNNEIAITGQTNSNSSSDNSSSSQSENASENGSDLNTLSNDNQSNTTSNSSGNSDPSDSKKTESAGNSNLDSSLSNGTGKSNN